MNLKDWLRARNVKPMEFARRIGHSAAAVSRWCDGLRVPEPPIAKKIREATGGEVTPDDFHDHYLERRAAEEARLKRRARAARWIA